MEPKQAAGERAVEFIHDGMIIGLGTGSTVYYTILKVGELVKQGLKIRAVYSSDETRELACSVKIPLIHIDEIEQIDLTIDGADEIDPDGNGIKGRWGALLYEKIVASISVKNIWVVEKRKMVKTLGKFPLPVDVMPFGHQHVLRRLKDLGYNPVLRMKGKQEFRTNSNHFIIDLYTDRIEDPYPLDQQLKKIPGVVEHGLFLDTVNIAVVANGENTEIVKFR